MACHRAKLHKICLLSDLTAVVLFWFSKKTFPEFVVCHKQNHGAYQTLLINNQSYQPLHRNAGCVKSVVLPGARREVKH